MNSDKERFVEMLYGSSIFIKDIFNSKTEDLKKIKETNAYCKEMNNIIDGTLKRLLALKQYIDQIPLPELSAEIDELENLSQKYGDTLTDNYNNDIITLCGLFREYQDKFHLIINSIYEYKSNMGENFNSEDLSNTSENNGTEQDSIENNEGSLEEEGILSLEERINNIRINQNQSYAEQVFLVIIEYQLEMIKKDMDMLEEKINDKPTIKDLVSLKALEYQESKLNEMKSKPYILSLAEKKKEKKMTEIYSELVNISQIQTDDTTTVRRMSEEKKRKKIMELRNKIGKIAEEQRNISYQNFDKKYQKMLKNSKLKAKLNVYSDVLEKSKAFQVMKKVNIKLKGSNRIEEDDDLETYPDEEVYDNDPGRSR